MASQTEDDGDVEQFREFIVDGELYQALDLSRRLLQLETSSFSRRADAALLLLDRLRSNRDDSADHANALLRVLANYATPTKELTEELLSLLFFCEHRVQIIHHLSKLTYQSRECVQLVLNAYIDLLSSDRSLLVPILGSLADLPLQSSDKSRVVDATESMLDAASEDDVPAVVQSLLSMLVPANAPRIVRKIRSQCNRLTAQHHSSTLSLTMDVVLRHAVAGSSALVAFLRVIRHCEMLTVFDVVLLAMLLARASENEAAQRVVATLTSKNKWTRVVVYETMHKLRSHKWEDAFCCIVRLASALLAAHMKRATRSSATAASSTVQCAVEMLSYLVVFRTTAQEEALSLLLSMVSQPQRLLLSASRAFGAPANLSLCWEVAQCVASQLAHVAAAHASSLVPFAHIFLDHLYAVASSSGHSGDAASSAYPTPILESLCRTMITLAKHEPGMVSLLMITIQKQLVVPAATTQSHAAAILQVKQLMAVFLAGEMLRQAVGDKSDRVSLLSWVRKLLSSAAVSDETTVHVVRLLSCSDLQHTLSTSDGVASSTLLSAVFRRHGFALRGHAEVVSRYGAAVDVVPGLVGHKSGWLEGSAVFDVPEFVRVARLGRPPIGWQALGDQSRAKTLAETTAHAKLALLKVQITASLTGMAINSESKDRALVCSFVLPTVNEDTTTTMTLPTTLWSYVCALQYAILSTNTLAARQQNTTRSRVGTDVVRQRNRLLQRVQACWVLHQRLCSLLEETKRRLKKPRDEKPHQAVQWLQLQIDLIENQAVNSSVFAISNAESSDKLSSLGGRLSLQVVSAVFEGLWKQQASTIESGLEIELFRAFPARLHASAASIDQDHERKSLDRRHAGAPAFVALQTLIDSQDGKRTIKYLSRRLFDYAEQLATMDNQVDAEDADAQEDEATMTASASASSADVARQWVEDGVHVLCDALRAIIETCRQQQEQRRTAVSHRKEERVWEETAMELLAKGTIDQRMRRPADSPSSVWAASCEVVFRSLASAATRAKDGEVACGLMEVLLSLVAHTQRQSQLSQLSHALLHVPYPTTPSMNSSVKLPLKIPHIDPVASASITSLLRPMPRKYHHLVYLAVGAWATASTLRSGLTNALYICESMEALVQSAAAEAVKRTGSRKVRGRKGLGDEPEEEDDIQNWVARDGEHRVLKNLTNDTLPFLLETLVACLADSPLRASLGFTSGRRVTSAAASNPFVTLIGAIAVLSKCIDVFISADVSGFNFSMRASSSILRIGPIVMKNVGQAITASLAWRRGDNQDQSSNSSGAAALGASLEHVQSLLEAAHGLINSLDQATQSFQDKVVLKMQQSASVGGPVADLNDENSSAVATVKGKASSRGGRWGNELLRHAHGKQFQRRRALSRNEAKLLPYFTHAVEQLKSLVADQSGIYRIELEQEHVAETVASALEAFRMSDEQFESVLATLETDEETVATTALAADTTLNELWSRWNPDDELDGDGMDFDQASQEHDDTQSSDEGIEPDGDYGLDNEEEEVEEEEEEEEEDEDAYAQIQRVATRKRTPSQSQSQHHQFVPQLKRIKPTQN